MRTLDCPRCGSVLCSHSVPAEQCTIVVDLCREGCGGVWLDADDTRVGGDLLGALEGSGTARSAASPIREVDCTSPTSCPVCQVTMRRYRWNYNSPVVLDQCPEEHGLWIDAGEVTAIRAIVAEDHEPLPPAQQARLRARLEAARLDIQTRLRRADHAGRLPHPAIAALEQIWARFL